MMQNRFTTIGLITALLAWPSFTSPVSAGGYEFPGGGPRAMGRGSASLARSDDPFMALLNPASLASQPAQFMVGTQLVFQKSCMDRDGTYDAGYVGGTVGEPSNVEHSNLCNGTQIRDRMSLLPMIGGTMRLHKRVGMLLALDPPIATREMIYENAVQQNQFGRDTAGWVFAQPGVNAPNGLVPAPTRYMLAKSDVVVLYPTISFGVKLADWLQIGAGFAWGFARVQFTNYTAFGSPGESSDEDTSTAVKVRDWFMPRVIASIHAIPHDRVDIMVGFRWDDDLRASGETKAQVPNLGEARGEVSYLAPRPWWITGGIRYAHRTAPRKKLSEATGPSGATDDPMKNEVFDIEVNVVYERNSAVKDHLFNSAELNIFTNPGDTDSVLTIDPFENPIKVPHRWQDQFSVRLGSDYNVMPGQLAIRFGFSYETNGFRDGFGYIDFWPMQRFGGHLGLSGRFGKVEMTAGYAFFYHTDFNNPNGQSQQIVIGPAGPVEPDASFPIINSGNYTSIINTVGWSLRVVFD